jgi:FAD/FMN-containing dehydrogenase
VGGFLLGGGYTYFTDQYGLAVDNIVSHKLVLPNGTFVEASEQVNPDLFFALKVRD